MHEVKTLIKKIFLIFSLFLISVSFLYSEDFYWESPIALTSDGAYFPVALSNKNYSYLIWQEVDEKEHKIYLTCRRYDDANHYVDNERFAGPFPFSESGKEVPDIFTAALLENGTVSVAVLSDIGEISVYTSSTGGRNFLKKILNTNGIMVAPRIYATKNNTFKLFTSLAEDESFEIYTSDSKDGITWSELRQFTPAISSSFRNPFIPVLGSLNGQDVVVFQAQYSSPETGRLSYQLYMTYFDEILNTWSTPVLLTDEDSLNLSDSTPFYKYQNQRPYLYNYNGKLYMSWERMSSTNIDIWVGEIDERGLVDFSAQQVSNQGSASRGILFSYNGNLICNWFDSSTGHDVIYMAEKIGTYWEETVLVQNSNNNMFTYPFVIHDNGELLLNFVWQQKTPSRSNENEKNVIAMLCPDTTVLPPTLKPLTYKKGKSSRNEEVEYEIIFPHDSSEIAGYSYTWQKDYGKIPNERIMGFPRNRKLKVKAPEDGDYILNVRVQDYAGNWSEPCEISYHRDLTPPLAPIINIDNVDEYGFLSTNYYNLKWEPSEAEDLRGYIYRVDRLGGIPKELAISSRHPYEIEEEEILALKEELLSRYEGELSRERRMSEKNITSSNFTERFSGRWNNGSNGVYLLSVCAIDEVGNKSDVSKAIYILNKFEPYTYISSIKNERDDYGANILTIEGYGFTYDGTISEIYVDRDGKAPYDYVLKQDEDFDVKNNSRIENIYLGMDIPKGEYKVFLNHTDRGLYPEKYEAQKVFDVLRDGTIKIEAEFQPPHYLTSEFERIAHIIASNTILLVSFIVVLVLVIIFIILSIIFSIEEIRLNNKESHALLKGDRVMANKKQKEKHLPSLKGKLIRFTFALIIVIVVAVTYQNGRKSIEAQKKTMASGLLNRTEVLLESVCTGGRKFINDNNLLEVAALPNQKNAMDEVRFITILGKNKDNPSVKNLNYLLTTNDLDISSKIKDYKNDYVYGELEITDEVYKEICKKCSDLDPIIKNKVAILDSDITKMDNEINNLSKQNRSLTAKEREENQRKISKLDVTSATSKTQLNNDLINYSNEAVSSIPYFDVENLDMHQTSYLFYKPIMYRDTQSGNFVHAVVILELSTESLLESVNKEFERIILLGLIIAAIAVLAGIIGSYLFASLIVRPIKKLEAHVTMIGETKNKINLKGKDVKIKSNDEVGRLGDAINVMTHELVTNAEEEELAMDGKAVQKAFLPLADTGVNTKNTIAEYEDKNLQIYGYYEGEAGVSGDYFDYKKLDDKWYGIIKCDASGHGIPAAIIMTVVATIFRRYFEKWSFAKNGVRLNTLVEQINDFIEGLGLKGKFATLIICLLNVKTGELYMCNAGDNLVHIFDGETRKMKVITLSSAPTAGVFPSDLVSLRGGFVVEKTILNKGDTLFLYTDGIEESNRRIRESDWSVRQNEVTYKKFNPKTREEETLSKYEDAKEEFGPERVAEIIESVYNKKKYVLTKENNPNSSETLEFDFEKCEGTVKDSILALASLEKVYRLYKSDTVQPTDYIKIDKKIDEFLSRYFNRYSYYAANKSEVAENSNYVDYDEMLEDEQSDDLTLLAIKRI